MDIYNDYMVTE